MKSTPAPARIIFLAVVLVALGFALGIGYQTLQYADRQTRPTEGNGVLPTRSPLVRGLRVSPDDKLLAFSAVYAGAQQAGRILFDLKTYNWNEAKTPAGWQDAISQWSNDGKRILFARERIPRPPGDGVPGLYEEAVRVPQKNQKR